MGVYLSHLEVTRANAHDQERGLVAFVSVTVNETLRLSGLTVRRERSGALSLSYPQRRDGNGCVHELMRPVHAHARRIFQSQVFEEIRKRGIDL